MAILSSQLRHIKTFSNGEGLQTFFLHPKLVIFEGTRNFRIVCLEATSDGESKSNCEDLYELDHEIVDKTLLDHLLWILLKTGELLVVDVRKGTRINIKIDNYANYNIHSFQKVNCKLFLVNKSGECLRAPYSTKEMDQQFEQGVTDTNACLEKSRLRHSDFENVDLKKSNGLYVDADAGNVIVKCPLTGLITVISSTAKILDVMPWGEVIVLTDKSNMWLVDVADSNIQFEFKNEGANNYYPLAAFNDRLYYLLWNKSEINIYCAWNSSTEAEDIHGSNSSINVSIKQTSQETLKTQVQSVVDAAIAGAEPLQVLTQLKSFYEKIEDYIFLIETTTKLCQYNIVYKSILCPLQKQVYLTGDRELNNLVSNIKIKVDLLEYVCFKGNNSSYESINFFEQNLKQLCTMFITKSDLDLASICWLKYSEMKIKLMPMDILDILNAIPHNIKMSALIIWLRNFVPPLLDVNPYFIDIFVKWTSQRVFLLEQSGYWPKIGLKFIDEIMNVLERSLKTMPLRPISIDDLDMLKDHINYIMELKAKYKINMLIGEISSQSPSEVALIMLRRCYTEDLCAFLQDYLPTFATRFLFEADDTLRSYIESEAATCGGGIDSSRLKILLEAFRSPTDKLDCLLQVLKVLDVPWDTTVLDLAIAAAASMQKDFTISDADRTLAQEIQKELNFAEVKVILKKYNFPLTCTDYTLVLHKLINAANVDLNDLKVITSVMTAYTNYGHVLYIDRLLRDCETRVALEFFTNLSSKDKKILLKTIMIKYEQIIDVSTNDIVMERNYLDFLKGTKYLNDIETHTIENLYHLKNSYDITLNMNSIYNERFCADVANTWTYNDGVTASSGRGRCVTQLTGTHQSRHAVVIALLRRTSTSNQVRRLVESFLISVSCDEDNKRSDIIASVLSEFKDGRNTALLLESFHILIELVAICNEEHLRYLMKCLSMLNTLINLNIVVKNLSVIWKFHYIFLPMSSVTSTNDLIDLYTAPLNNLDMIFANGNIINDVMIFRILGNLLERSAIFRNQLSVDYLEVKDGAVQRLLPKVIASLDLDEVLLTSLLLMLSEPKDVEDGTWILETLRGQNESLPLAITCYLSSSLIRKTFALDNILPGNAMTYPPQYLLKSKFNINLNEMALPDCTEETWDVKVVLFYVLRQYPDTSLERLVELCRTLNVSVNDGLSLQLISLISTWELKYKVFNDNLECRQLYSENDENDIISKCFSIWESIDDKVFLRDILNDFWKNGEVTLHGRLVCINPYYYEIYICIYHLIYGSTGELRNKKEYFLLNFLKDYTRKSTPKQYEYELFSVKGMFPEIGHYRLPFHLFMREDMWLNLKSEITLETYERWLSAVSLLSLDADLQTAKDMICSNALKQTMTARKRNEIADDGSAETEPWRLSTKEERLLRAAHRCVRHIANMEWAGACLFYVLQGCARGADQVAAAHLCYQFAQRWAALQPGNRAVRQMERLYSTLSTRHALYKIEWAREEFVRLVTEPAQLIRVLYLHPNFVEKMSRHDVNRAANEIADKNGINISSIRIQILENILSKSDEENKNDSFCGLDTKKLMTAKYILKATCPKMGAIYLSRIAFDDESDFDKCKKLRALQCLISIVEPETAMKVTNRERDELWSLLLELLFVINLESVDMPWVVATFMQDKITALEQLVQAAAANVNSLKIAADLARRFGNVKVIRDLIPLLLRTALYEELIPLLLKVSSPPDDIIYTAWRAVILSPFQKADYPITETQKTKCLNAINLLPLCPIIKDDDLIEIWRNCVRCKCFGLGCLVLPYITPEKRQSLTELQKIDRRNLIASLKNLHSETYLVSGAMCVVESLSLRVYR